MFVLGLVVLLQPMAAQEQASKDVATEKSAAGKDATTAQSAADKDVTTQSAVEGTASAKGAADTSAKQGNHAVPAKYDVSKIGDRGIGGGINFYSLQREMAMGRQLADQVDAQARIVTDPMVNNYINKLGQTIVRNSDAKVPFTIKVIDNEEVNAFALPGGYFYVNSGLIMAADNGAELAGVMAHEIAHVAARHGTRTVTRNQLLNLASIPLIFVGGPLVFAMEQAAGVAVPMSFLKFSREAELEADLLGVEYEYSAGYDPAAFVQFFEKLGTEKKHKFGLLAKAFSTHPMTGERIKRAQEDIQEYLPPRSEYMLDTSEFQEVKAHLISVLDGRRLMGPQNGNHPTLHRRGHPTLNTGASTNDSASDSAKSTTETASADDDGRPTLKRKD